MGVKKFIFVLLLGVASCGTALATNYSNLVGNWKGLWTIDANGSNRVFLKITNSSGAGAFDNLDTGDNNILVTSFSASPAPSVYINFFNGYSYTGVVNTAFTQISGTWFYNSQSWSLTFYRNPSVDDFQANIYTNGSSVLPYRLFVPTNYVTNQSFPLILYLHGSGVRGTDNWYQLVGDSGPLALVFNENQAQYPCFVAAPQCPPGGDWTNNTMHQTLVGLLSTLVSAYNIDTNRVYITGLSLGGNGTWDMMTRNPNLFAAGVPMSGQSGTASAAAVYEIPTWVFHSLDDPTVPVGYSQIMVNGMRALGGAPIYTEYATGQHEIWSASYANRLLYSWLLNQKRGSPSNAPPFVLISSPATAGWYDTPATNATLSGSAGNAIAQVSQITWTNNRSGSGTALGTTNWSAQSVPLQTSTNLLTVMATGSAWVSNYGGHTTFSSPLWAYRGAQLSFSASNGLATVSWTGGAPPYALDQCTNLSSHDWQPLLTNNSTSAQIPLSTSSTFFRIRSQ